MAASPPPIEDRMHPSLGAGAMERAWRAIQVPVAGDASICVQCDFLVSQQLEGAWIRKWRSLAHLAGGAPGCRHFRLMRDRGDALYFSVYSEWETVEAYCAFERQQGVKALEGDLASLGFAERSQFLDVVALEPGPSRHDA